MKEQSNIVAYVIALVNEFGKYFRLTDRQAFMYLKRFGAISLIIKNYGAAHTLSFEDNIEMLATYCQRAGGELNYEVISR